MADQADVENALVAIAANALYPNGALVPSTVGNTCRVYRGFPAGPALDADLAAGVVNVSVMPAEGGAKDVTRYPRIWLPVAPVAATLIALVDDHSASFSGSCARGQLAGVAVNGALFAYAVQASDTPATVVSNLAALLQAAGWLVDYTAASLAVPGARMFLARVVNGAGALQEIRRQVQAFKFVLWCSDPAIRDAVAPVLDLAMAAQNFISLADGSSARVKAAGSVVQDGAADAALYRRDLIYSVEYPTTLAQMTPAMLFGASGFSANGEFLADFPA